MEHCLPLTDRSSLRLARRVLPEHLDVLPPDDPLARRSRRDLQRVHRVMRSLMILRRAARLLPVAARHPRTILELGAGDGTLMLRFARSGHSPGQAAQVTFLDQQDLISPVTRRKFRSLGWQVQVLTEDALKWARDASAGQYDLGVTTLFLHHFQTPALELLLRAVALRCRAFIALEPRRNRLAWAGSHLLGLLGANQVTREDGVTSVVAGFSGHELSALWSADGDGWRLQEYFAWPFTHCFVAARQSVAERQVLASGHDGAAGPSGAGRGADANS